MFCGIYCFVGSCVFCLLLEVNVLWRLKASALKKTMKVKNVKVKCLRY